MSRRPVAVNQSPAREKSEESIRNSEIYDGSSSGKVTDEELLQVLALVQITSGIVLLFVCSLGILAIYVEKQPSFSDKIPGSDLIFYQFIESMISTISGILVKFGFPISINCCKSTKPTPFIRVISIVLDVILLVLASVALFWPNKSYMSPVTLATIYTIEVIFYSALVIFLSRLMVPGTTKLPEDTGPKTQSSA